MGSFIEINDTLQISKVQGFPRELDIKEYLEDQAKASESVGKVFQFQDKPGIRFYHMPPVRVFLVENIDGKWVYWGLAHILEIRHDYEKKVTSGKYKIIYLYSPEELKMAHNIIDRNEETRYDFNQGAK